MKTKVLIATIALILSSATFSFANAPRKFLTLHTSYGRMFSIPVKVEEANDTLPFDIKEEFKKNRFQDVNQSTFDITPLVKPEQEVNDLNIELR